MLTEEALRAAAGDRVFRHGEDAVARVHGLHVVGSTAQGSVQARRVHVAELDWSGTELSGRCTCSAGELCRHAVAVGLAAIAELAGREAIPVEAQLARLSVEDLRDIVAELAARDPAVARMVAVRAGGGAGETVDALVAAVDTALSTRGFVDHRRSFDVAHDAQDLLDELEGHLDGGAADAVRPALRHALAELVQIVEQADDSSGVLQAAGQRAADLYARSCREGHPDAVQLARWLVEFRAAGHAWLQTPLADFAAAFDAEALAVYEAGVEQLTGADRRRDVDRMRVELADHRGDVDGAIAILAADDPPAYAAVVRRLREAGRDDEVLDWMERAARAGRVSGRLRSDHVLDAMDVATTLADAGRGRAALDVLRAQFRDSPGHTTYDALVRMADRFGLRDDERAWALAAADAALPWFRGPARIEIALGEGDLAAAWAAAEQHGAGHRWRQLAEASAETMPREAADLYRRVVDEDLRIADTKRYPGIAAMLAQVRDLYAAAGAGAEFAEYLAEIRTRFGRRTSLMAQLDRRGL
ncbi:SWIM zinc finger family protein [Pseudonocardia sp. CA-107938]|uniref:SWIM zinc finger family protein n=1 Tax=Pseudonocardia sp. CA-107938 TaxID=3240021 RepID=UPI003D9183FA